MPRRFGERCYTEINSDGVAVGIGIRTYRNTRQVHDLAIPQDGEIVGLGGAVKTAGKVTDGAADLAVYFQDGVPFPQAVGAALGVVGKLGHGGAAQLTACNNQHQQHHKAQHKVHHRTAQRIGGTSPSALENFGAETDGKFLDMDAAVAGGKKMPQFMYQNDRPKHEQ